MFINKDVFLEDFGHKLYERGADIEDYDLSELTDFGRGKIEAFNIARDVIKKILSFYSLEKDYLFVSLTEGDVFMDLVSEHEAKEMKGEREKLIDAYNNKNFDPDDDMLDSPEIYGIFDADTFEKVNIALSLKEEVDIIERDPNGWNRYNRLVDVLKEKGLI